MNLLWLVRNPGAHFAGRTPALHPTHPANMDRQVAVTTSVVMPSVLTEIEVVIPQLYRYAFALLRNRADADDLVNATLLRALDKLHTRQEEGNLRAWIFAIMHNLHVSRRHRAQYRSESFPIDDADNTDMVPAPKEAHARLEDVVRALDRLPEDQRIVVLLVSIEDLSYAETAYVTNAPIGTVMHQLAYGRERLRQLLGDETPPALRLVK